MGGGGPLFSWTVDFLSGSWPLDGQLAMVWQEPCFKYEDIQEAFKFADGVRFASNGSLFCPRHLTLFALKPKGKVHWVGYCFGQDQRSP